MLTNFIKPQWEWPSLDQNCTVCLSCSLCGRLGIVICVVWVCLLNAIRETVKRLCQTVFPLFSPSCNLCISPVGLVFAFSIVCKLVQSISQRYHYLFWSWPPLCSKPAILVIPWQIPNTTQHHRVSDVCWHGWSFAMLDILLPRHLIVLFNIAMTGSSQDQGVAACVYQRAHIVWSCTCTDLTYIRIVLFIGVGSSDSLYDSWPHCGSVINLCRQLIPVLHTCQACRMNSLCEGKWISKEMSAC